MAATQESTTGEDRLTSWKNRVGSMLFVGDGDSRVADAMFALDDVLCQRSPHTSHFHRFWPCGRYYWCLYV